MAHATRVLWILAILVLLPLSVRAIDPQIAFAVPGTQRYVKVMDADGSNVRAVYEAAKFTPCMPCPSWSPDGQDLVFERCGISISRIPTDRLTTEPELTELYPVPGYFADGTLYDYLPDAVWSRNPDEIAVLAGGPSDEGGSNAMIGVMQADGSAAELIYTARHDDLIGLAWSFDGERIATFEATVPAATEPQELIIVNRLTGLVEVRIAAADVGAPAGWGGRDLDWFSTDSYAQDLIAFSAGPSIQDSWVYLFDLGAYMALGPGNYVTPVISGSSPSFSADGSGFVFDDSSQKIRRHTLASGQTERLGRGLCPDWLRVMPECSTDADCGTGEICCAGSCQVPMCEYDSECDDGDDCTDDTCYPCSGCENVFDPENDPSCEPICQAKGESCAHDAECCSGLCHPVKGACK